MIFIFPGLVFRLFRLWCSDLRIGVRIVWPFGIVRVIWLGFMFPWLPAIAVLILFYSYSQLEFLIRVSRSLWVSRLGFLLIPDPAQACRFFFRTIHCKYSFTRSAFMRTSYSPFVSKPHDPEDICLCSFRFTFSRKQWRFDFRNVLKRIHVVSSS